jgi:wyosine [tRNA(Phe)-imidazoG37] synthetase (radical SAM superfamily)
VLDEFTQKMSIICQGQCSASRSLLLNLTHTVVEIPQKTINPPETTETQKKTPARFSGSAETAFGSPRDFLDNRFVYAVVSARARGLSVGVNLCPDKNCNFDCVYCEVHRNGSTEDSGLDVEAMAAELKKTLAFVRSGRLRGRPWYRNLPDELLQLRHVALSGDGEPTLSPKFAEALQAVVHVRALGGFPFFKLVLITNATGLDLPHVQQGLKYFTRSDEVWAKLDGGTQAHVNKVNRSQVPLEKILSNILLLGRQRPVVIQSLFPSINGEEPPLEEIDQYARRLFELKEGGAEIPLVQIYSATRPSPNSLSGHLPLKALSRIAHTVKQVTGLRAEVF